MGEFPQLVLTAMATAALEQVLAWGVDRIQDTVSTLTTRLEHGVVDAGAQAVPAADRVGHLMGIRLQPGIGADLLEGLATARVHVSVRGDGLRVAPHVFNTEADINRLAGILRHYIAHA